MNSSPLTINGEKAVFEWKDGRVRAEGYDLENEKMALALNNNLGEGIGVMLVALNEYCPKEKSLRHLLYGVETGLQELKAESKKNRQVIWRSWHWGNIFCLYASFSPDIEMRKMGVSNAAFNARGYLRMLSDPDPDIVWRLAHRQDLPKYMLYKLAKKPIENVRREVANHFDLPLKLMEYLSNDESALVRQAIAQHNLCPNSILIKLSQDENEDVRKMVFGRRGMNQDLELALIKTCSLERRKYIAQNSVHQEVLSILAADTKKSVAQAAKDNYYNKLVKSPKVRSIGEGVL